MGNFEDIWREKVQENLRQIKKATRKSHQYIEVYMVKYRDCGVKVEKAPLLPGKAPFSPRFEVAVAV